MFKITIRLSDMSQNKHLCSPFFGNDTLCLRGLDLYPWGALGSSQDMSLEADWVSSQKVRQAYYRPTLQVGGGFCHVINCLAWS